jgi:hypothetical protein
MNMKAPSESLGATGITGNRAMEVFRLPIIQKTKAATGLEIEVETSSPRFIRGEEIPIAHQPFSAVKTTTPVVLETNAQPQLSTVS